MRRSTARSRWAAASPDLKPTSRGRAFGLCPAVVYRPPRPVPRSHLYDRHRREACTIMLTTDRDAMRTPLGRPLHGPARRSGMPAQEAIGPVARDEVGVEELSPAEAVAAFELSLATLRRLLSAGELEARKVRGVRGVEWRIPASAHGHSDVHQWTSRPWAIVRRATEPTMSSRIVCSSRAAARSGLRGGRARR